MKKITYTILSFIVIVVFYGLSAPHLAKTVQDFMGAILLIGWLFWVNDIWKTKKA